MEYTQAAEVEVWLQQLKELEQKRQCAAPLFLKPYHLATLAHRLRLRAVRTLGLPEKIGPYANTMNLWGALGIAPPREILSRHAAGRYYPVELLRDSNKVDDTADELVGLFKSVNCDDTTIDAIHTMLRELLGNCYAHSDVRDGVYGVICAQIWAGGKKAQIAIADTGIGIRGSLTQNPDLLDIITTSNCCELATEYGVTSKPGKGHSGYGLAVARKLIEQNNGALFVRSGEEAFCLRSGRVQSFKAKYHWDGTLLIIEWDIYGPMNIGEVYDSFPLPEGMTDDDFNF
jgi:anti-sigma regulatory factor (Ser/Thr protein kinase)